MLSIQLDSPFPLRIPPGVQGFSTTPRYSYDPIKDVEGTIERFVQDNLKQNSSGRTLKLGRKKRSDLPSR